MNFFRRLFRRPGFYLGLEIRSDLPIRAVAIRTEETTDAPAQTQQSLPMTGHSTYSTTIERKEIA